MAAQDSPESHAASSQNAEAVDGFVGVLRASRMEATVSLGNNETEETVIQRKSLLIQTDKRQNGCSEHEPSIPRFRYFVQSGRPAILMSKTNIQCALSHTEI